MRAGIPSMSAATEGAGVEQSAVGHGAAKIVKVITDHAASLVQTGVAPFVDTFRCWDIDRGMGISRF